MFPFQCARVSISGHGPQVGGWQGPDGAEFKDQWADFLARADAELADPHLEVWWQIDAEGAMRSAQGAMLIA